jgi:sec-independent protein translocase protein TatC
VPTRKYDEDLFAGSTMTFGEHLEELRVCLFKSLAALVVGSVVGLLVGNYVVEFIQIPLTRALETYHESQTAESAMAAAQAAGDVPSDELETITEFVEKNHLLMDQVLVDPDQVIEALRQCDPKRFGALPAPKEPAGPSDSKTTGPAGGKDAGPRVLPKSREDLIPLLIWRPTADDPRIHAKSLNPAEPFVIYMKASLLVGALLASPYIFYQIWSFVAAGLYPHEQHYVRLFLPFSLILFLLGAATAFFLVFEPVLNFLFSFNRLLGIEVEPRITEWLGFVLVMPLGFGISFQLPLVMLFLERIGVFNVRVYLSKWRVSVLVIFILAMVLTPSGDPYSMLLMAMPLLVLYFFGIGLCKYLPRRRSPFNEE